ncbi:MAG: hypothetical protein OEW58_13955, partial [Gammaproteobacteria bacterium]|nr:hypothetical protein [Gammaproteobacteria bacterium]
MMNLSSLFRASSLPLALVASLSAMGYFLWSYGFDLVVLSLFLLTIVLMLVGMLAGKKEDETLLNQLKQVTTEVGRGQMNNRVVHIGRDDKLGEVAWQVNDMLDQLETFFREVKASFYHVSQGRYFRRPISSGLHGDFKKVIEQIDDSLGLIIDNQRNSGKYRLLSDLGHRNSENLLRDLTRTQLELTAVNNQVEGVKEIAQGTAERAQSSQQQVGNVISNLAKLSDMADSLDASVIALKERA